MNRVLAVFAFGRGAVVLSRLEPPVEEFLREVLGLSTLDDMHLDIEGAAFECPRLGDGIWVLEASLVDAGPGDWPGSREFVVRFSDARLATRAEWAAFVAGEWPESFIVAPSPSLD